MLPLLIGCSPLCSLLITMAYSIHGSLFPRSVSPWLACSPSFPNRLLIPNYLVAFFFLFPNSVPAYPFFSVSGSLCSTLPLSLASSACRNPALNYSTFEPSFWICSLGLLLPGGAAGPSVRALFVLCPLLHGEQHHHRHGHSWHLLPVPMYYSLSNFTCWKPWWP